MTNKRRPLLTISIPTWNRVGYVRGAIDSITKEVERDRLHDEVEILISDNGSDDDTQAVVEERARRYPYVRYIRNERNMGMRFNLLQVMRRADGEYCMLIGDDDRLTEGSPAAIIKSLTKYRGIPALFLHQAGGNNVFTDIDEDQPVTLERICSDYFYDIGQAGVFVLETDRARSVIDEYGIEFFNDFWPQTQVMCIGLARTERASVITPIEAVNSNLHRSLSVYTSYYLWHISFVDLFRTAKDIAPMIGKNLYEKISRTFAPRLKGLKTVIQFHGAFIDSREQRRKTAADIRKVIPLLPWKLRLSAFLLWMNFMLPQRAAALLYRARIRLRHGYSGIKFLDSQVHKELSQREQAKSNLSVRELT
jgi:glycosyltransferase involved in cell wall biosynthesis